MENRKKVGFSQQPNTPNYERNERTKWEIIAMSLYNFKSRFCLLKVGETLNPMVEKRYKKL